MKLLLVVLVVGLAVAEEATPEPITLFYHESVGIKEAAAIKQAEEATDFSGARIVGGHAASLGQHPHLGGLVIALTTGATSVCGSSLLSNTRALTAAHCWWDGRLQAVRFTLVLGSLTLFSGGTRLTTDDVVVHQSFNPYNFNNDLAMITISHVNYNNYIRNIAIATGSTDFAGTWVWAAGFGRQSDTAGIGFNQSLHQMNVQVVRNTECAQALGAAVVGSTICTSGVGGRGVCGGDSGGPLHVGGGSQALIGVASFGAPGGCQRGLPSAFVRVTSFTAWIQAHL